MVRPILAGVLPIALLTASVAAQQSKNPPKPAAEKMEQFEEVHRGIFGAKADPAGDAVRRSNRLAEALPASGKAVGKVARRNFIDEIIFSRIEKDKVPHAGLSTDEEFVRRAYLDATGELPSAATTRDFVASRDPQKRDRLIDQLVGTEQFAESWAWFWGDLFRLGSDTGFGKNAFQFWNKEWLRVDRPYNEVVTDLLTASSKSHSTLPALGLIGRNNVGLNNLPQSPDDFRVTNRLDAVDELSIDVSRLFLGVNTTCISCHDGGGHLEDLNAYLATRTRAEFYRQSAFFGKMRTLTNWSDRSKNTSNDDQVIDDLAKGYDTGNDAPYVTESLSRYPRDGKVYEPAFLLTGEKPRPGQPLRAELARILTGHPQFSRATVNLIWGKLMTVGFVEPYDGFDLARIDPRTSPPDGWTLQPTNAQLLDALATDFARTYSIQGLVKTIMKSSAYQLSARFPGEWKDSYVPYYSRKYIRLMTGPEVVDAIAKATNRPYTFNFSGVQATRVKEMAEPANVGGRRGGPGSEGTEINGILQAFFQSNRNTQVPDGNRPSTLQALLMTSTKVVNNRVLANKGSRVELALESSGSNNELIDELFLSSLSRKPTSAEREVALQALEKDRRRGAENIQWALLNSIEFVLNR